MNILVISAVNFTEGGPLKILNDCLYSCSKILKNNWIIYAIVHDKSLIYKNTNIKYIELKKSKTSWLYRLYYEYYKFNTISKQLNPDLWISLHDITPNVKTKKQIVYCHNSSPFFKSKLKHLYFDPKFYLFTKLYNLLYLFNIKKNDFVVVQQYWMKNKFKALYSNKNIIVAHPAITTNYKPISNSDKNTFFYPSIPRCHKNFEFLCDSAVSLAKISTTSFQVRITVNGNENRYARFLKSKYSKYDYIKFVGKLSEREMIAEYSKASVIVFPSLLETWGLPITEAKSLNKRLFVIDLPYTRETVGNYNDAHFFDANNNENLINLMNLQIMEKLRRNSVTGNKTEGLFARDWDCLIKMIT